MAKKSAESAPATEEESAGTGMVVPTNDGSPVEVEFTEDVDAGDGENVFKAGQKKKLAPASAYRWVRRRCAVYTDAKLQAETERTFG